MTVRVASYNLWNGASDTYFRLVDFAKEQKYDVLCLQEINGWQDDDFARLKDFADRAGYTTYQYGNSNSEYKLVTLTTLPVVSQTVHQEGFWHCVVETHVRLDDTELAIFNLHLDPWKEDPRVKEIEKVLAKVDPNKPTILTGDFNSVSRQDNYPPEFMAELQRRKIYKFGQDDLDFRVTDRLASAGFVDVAAKLGHLDITAPTPYGQSETKEEVPVTADEAPARIDYMFVSGNLMSLVQDLDVVKDASTDKISDHYPVVLTLGTEEPKPESAPKPVAEALPEVQPAPQPKLEAQPQNPNPEGELKIEH